MTNIFKTDLPHQKALRAIAIIKDKYGSHLFESGACHDLALLLQELFGGDIYACIRTEVDSDGVFFSQAYSHMVWTPFRYYLNENVTYDINGFDACTKWEARWSKEPDEKGNTSNFEWVKIEPLIMSSFIRDRKIVINIGLIKDCKALINKA